MKAIRNLQFHGMALLLILATGLLAPLQGNAQAAADTVQTTTQYAQAEEEATDTIARAPFQSKEYPGQLFSGHKIAGDTLNNARVRQLKTDDAYWYVTAAEQAAADTALLRKATFNKTQANKAGDLLVKQEERNGSLLPAALLDSLFWIVIVVVLLAGVIYFLLANKINIFARSGKGVVKNDAGDLLQEDIFELPYQQLLQKAYAEGNYRFAVRILYLQTLKLLSEKSLIHFQPDFTNVHYLLQLQPTPYYQPFFTITRHYEYIWYGQFTPAAPVFEKVKKDFLSMQNMLS